VDLESEKLACDIASDVENKPTIVRLLHRKYIIFLNMFYRFHISRFLKRLFKVNGLQLGIRSHSFWVDIWFETSNSIAFRRAGQQRSGTIIKLLIIKYLPIYLGIVFLLVLAQRRINFWILCSKGCKLAARITFITNWKTGIPLVN
jgi:hypothetical protein